MVASDYLKGKKILIVDDEPDILETLKEMLDMCIVDSATDFETALKLLRSKSSQNCLSCSCHPFSNFSSKKRSQLCKPTPVFLNPLLRKHD